MKKIGLWLALVSLFVASKSPAVALKDIQFWVGSGTNRAALVVQWSAPESFGYTTVPAPIADQSLVWGYRFNGTATGIQMFNAIVTADPRLYAVEVFYPSFGISVYGIGFHLGGGGDLGITDGSTTNFFTDGLLTNATVDIDAAAPLNPGDLYWGGFNGPNWETWNELGDAGGFLNSPDRGTNAYWTSTDPVYASSGFHGQWELAQTGLSSLQLTNGSWIGFSVAAGEFEFDLSAPYNAHKHAPAEPDAGITALVKNLCGGFQGGQWQAQFLSCCHWLYSLERSPDLQNWTLVTNGVSGNGTNLIIGDAAPPADKSFYRIGADQP
ncbi:MAG: hypothetical protein WAO02_17450 [Verrucomicrobiia bacterium]